MIDNNTGDEYEYPKCMFDGTWEKVWDASKGLKIPETVVPFTNGRLWTICVPLKSKLRSPFTNVPLVENSTVIPLPRSIISSAPTCLCKRET